MQTQKNKKQVSLIDSIVAMRLNLLCFRKEEKMAKEFVLTEENYYSDEANHHYLSAHTLMDYMENKKTCWMKHNGKLKKKTTDALVNGLLFHTFVETEEAFRDTLSQYAIDYIFPKTKKANKEWENLFIEEQRPEDFQVLSPYKDVWEFITSHWEKRFDLWQTKPKWQKEVMLTATIGGTKFRGKLDALYVDTKKQEAVIFDHKTIALKGTYGRWYDIERDVYRDKTFMEEYHYDLQLSIYQELVHQTYGIPKENIKFQFGMLVKKGTTQFVEYPSGYVLTEQFNDDYLKHRTFSDEEKSNLTAMEYVERNAKKALAYINDPQPNDLSTDILYATLNADTSAKIPLENVRL